MKKILLSLGVVMASFAFNAQNTISGFFTGNLALYGLDDVMPIDSGYVAGNNYYGDKAKIQKFDATHGIPGGGTITGVKLGIPVKVDGGGSYTVQVWDDNAGVPGTVLGSKTMTIASIDTAFAAFAVCDAPSTGVYNVQVNFNTPITIPANKTFYVGVVLPTGNNLIALLHNAQNSFADALTHTWEQWSDDSFNSFGDPQNWNLKIALAIFPLVNFTAGINEEEAASLTVYPNPANDVLNVAINGTIETVSVISMDGKVVISENVNASNTAVNVAGLNAGVYVYEVKTATGSTVRNTFVKN